MRKSRFSEEEIIGLLKEAEAGRRVADLCREHGISEATFYRCLHHQDSVSARISRAPCASRPAGALVFSYSAGAVASCGESAI
jgi:putative transposase